MDFKKFACKSCGHIPKSEKILKCKSHHIYCWECALEVDNVCECDSRLVERPHPLQDNLKKQNINNNGILCLYEFSGCTYNFPSKGKYYNDHILECKYRPYQCILKKFKIMDCRWCGYQLQFEEHFKKCHVKNIGKIYTHSETDSIIFKPKGQNSDNYQRLRLINAFNKNFVFYYLSDRIEKFISIIIFLIGKKDDSDKYGYDFTFLSPDTVGKRIKIKYSQACFNDNDDIYKMIKDGKCVSLPYYVAQNYVKNNEIQYYFRMTKMETIN